MARAWVAAGVASALALGTLAGCGHPAKQASPGPATPVAPAVWPLLGTPGGDPDRPALAVKVDATAAGRPQYGLAEADLVVEEMVEGGLTRLLVVYHSQDPGVVGPVRSARSTDLPILAELGEPLFAWSGANARFEAMVEAADLLDVGAGAAPAAYWRDGERHAPYNLLAGPAELRSAGGPGSAPPALFAYAPTGDRPAAPGERPVSGFDTAGARGLASRLEWRWDAGSGRWLRWQSGSAHVDAAGRQVAAANVIVRWTSYHDSGMRDVTGGVVPEADLVGSGTAVVLVDGHAIPATWTKPDAASPTDFRTVAGAPVRLAPGPTWVELLPPGTGSAG